MNQELLKVEEAAKLLKVRRETIRRYIKAGHLRAVTLPGGDYRLYEKDILKLLGSNQRGGEVNGR
jgi:excisionase family DNA binding protein